MPLDGQLAHMHNTRKFWLSQVAPERAADERDLSAALDDEQVNLPPGIPASAAANGLRANAVPAVQAMWRTVDDDCWFERHVSSPCSNLQRADYFAVFVDGEGTGFTSSPWAGGFLSLLLPFTGLLLPLLAAGFLVSKL